MNVVQMELGHLILMLMALLGAGVAGVCVMWQTGRCPATKVVVMKTDPRRRGWKVKLIQYPGPRRLLLTRREALPTR